MPKLMGKNESQTHQTLHGFQFSAAKIETLGASEYTLVTIVQDVSGSVQHFARAMELTLQNILEACYKSPRSANLLLRLVTFADNVVEIHGFRELGTIQKTEYDNILKCYGSTALRDASLNSAEASETYSKKLSDIDYRNNGVMYVLTDGMDNASLIARSPDDLKKAFNKIRSNEVMESFSTILIGVNDDQQVIDNLKKLKDEAGFDQFVEMGAATPVRLARLADFISKSISSTSLALTGQTSQPLTF